MMMFSFDSFFVYNNTRKKRGEKTHTRTNTEKTNRASVLSKSLEYGSSETKTETVREFTRAFTLDQCVVRFRNWFQMTKNASVCCLSFEIFCAFLKGE